MTLVALAVPLSPAPAANAQPTPPSTYDLLTDANVRIVGGLQAGYSVAGAGDVNGDSYDDVIVGSPATSVCCERSGAAYIVLGQPALMFVDMTTPASHGVRIEGPARGSWAGYAVAGAGDVNGDGFDDVLIGSHSGSAHIVYGDATLPSVIRLADIGLPGDAQGLRIDGIALDADPFPDNFSANWLGGAGDLNGDGYDDVVIGADGAGANNRDLSGSAYVVLGGPNLPGSLSAGDLGATGNPDGARIDGAAAGDQTGYSVSGAGDVNGDDFDDVIVGARGADGDGRADAGGADVIYGARELSGTLDLAVPNRSRWVRIDGALAGSWAGRSVGGAGDVNGDGYDDVIVGAIYADHTDRRWLAGAAYVVFGSESLAARVDLAQLRERGILIEGANTLDYAGWSVAGAGRVNGDQYADVVVGAIGADNNSRGDSGSAYVLYGAHSPPQTIDLAGVETPGAVAGFRADGAGVERRAGYSVAGAGDVTRDGCDDVIVGAPYGANDVPNTTGAAYIIYGCTRPSVSGDPACDAYGNRFGVFGFDVRTPDSPYAYEVSGVDANLLACGTKIGRASSYDAGGAGVQFVRFDIAMPRGVVPNTGPAPPQGSYIGRMNINVLTWRGNPWIPVLEPDILLELRVDTPLRCPAEAIVCFRGETRGGPISARNWSWLHRSVGGPLVLTIGKLLNDSFPSSPTGYTKIELNLCAYAGEPGTAACGSNAQPWLLRNGAPGATYYDYANCGNATPSYCPVDPPGTCASGRYPYVVTGTDRGGRSTQPAYHCHGWDYWLTPPAPPGGGRGGPAKPKRPAGGR